MEEFKKKDIVITAILGFIVAVAFIIVLENNNNLFSLALFALPAVPVLAVLAVYVTYFLSKKWPVFFQIGRFAAVGSSNFAIDIGILNLLQMFSGLGVSGIWYIIFKTLSFLISSLNSYGWNKFWTFKKIETEKMVQEFIIFLAITALNTVIDVSISSFLTNFVSSPFDLSQKLWGTLAAAVGAFIAMSLNFLSYKFIVFKKNDRSLSQIQTPKV